MKLFLPLALLCATLSSAHTFAAHLQGLQRLTRRASGVRFANVSRAHAKGIGAFGLTAGPVYQTKLSTGRNATAAKAESSSKVVSAAPPRLKASPVAAPVQAKVAVPVQASSETPVVEVAGKAEVTSTRSIPPVVVRTTRTTPRPEPTSTQARTTTPLPFPPPTTSSPPPAPTSTRIAAPISTPVAAIPQRPSSLESLALSSHNDFRASHGASPLTWSSSLATAAQKWAGNCVFEHSGGSLGPFGENLAAMSGTDNTIAQGTKMWNDEVVDYDPSNPVASHFTQVVWKGSSEVGCSVAACNLANFDPKFWPVNSYVCEYSKQGNIIGAFGENVE